MEPAEQIRHRLRATREKRGLSLNEVSAKLLMDREVSLSSQGLQHLETKAENFNSRILNGLASVYGVKVTHFFKVPEVTNVPE